MSGLEALGIAASIIQVADLGTKLSVKLFSFYRQVKNANESIQLLSNEVALVSVILRELGDNLKDENASKICSDEAFRTLTRVLDQCRDVLGQIERVTDNFNQPGKNRFQQVTEKFRLVLVDPALEPLKFNLERLKSTMLLLLNVIMYAVQIRSNHATTLLQQQRELIESLLEDRKNDCHKPHQTDLVTVHSQNSSMETDSIGSAYTATRVFDNQDDDTNPHQQYSREQPVEPVTSTNSAEAQTKPNGVTDGNEHPELKQYNILIHSMLRDIEAHRSKLEGNRLLRIKNGVLNIHSGEIVRFQLEHGPSVHIDCSLFAEKKTENKDPKPAFSGTLTGSSSVQGCSKFCSRSDAQEIFERNTTHIGGWIGNATHSPTEFTTGSEDFKNHTTQKLPSLDIPKEGGSFEHGGDDTQERFCDEGFLVPVNLEDLLAQWTTLDKHDINCG